MSSKDGSGWYPQKSHKQHDEYDTTEQLRPRSEVKELAILEKEKIEEINTHRTQIEEDYSDST